MTPTNTQVEIMLLYPGDDACRFRVSPATATNISDLNEFKSCSLDGGHEVFDGVRHALGVRRVLLVGGRVARVHRQPFGCLDHVAGAVEHGDAGAHDRLLRAPRLRADLGRDARELGRRRERVEVLDRLDERLGRCGALEPVRLREVAVQHLVNEAGVVTSNQFIHCWRVWLLSCHIITIPNNP